MSWYKRIFGLKELPDKEYFVDEWNELVKPYIKAKIYQKISPNPLGNNSALFLISCDFNGDAAILLDWQKGDKISIKNMSTLVKFMTQGQLKENILNILKNSEQTKDVKFLIKEIKKWGEEPFIDPESIL